MDRVIRTEFYLESDEIPSGIDPDELPSVSVAWLRYPNSGIDLERLSDFEPFPEFANHRFDRFAEMEAALARLLQEEMGPFGRVPPAVLEELLRSQERSPPSSEPFFGLLGKGAATLGTLLGINLAVEPGTAFVMLVTIPIGVIVVGSALGVSQGLRNGLSKRLEKALLPPLPEPRRQIRRSKKSSAKHGAKNTSAARRGARKSASKKSSSKKPRSA